MNNYALEEELTDW